MLHWEIIALGLVLFTSTAKGSMAADTSAHPETAEAERSNDFGWLYVLLALMLAACAIGAKEVLDGRCRPHGDAGQEEAIVEESLLEAGAIVEDRPSSRMVATSLPSLLATASACEGAKTTKATNSVVAVVAPSDTSAKDSEER